jgi:hypothetical protein
MIFWSEFFLAATEGNVQISDVWADNRTRALPEYEGMLTTQLVLPIHIDYITIIS